MSIPIQGNEPCMRLTCPSDLVATIPAMLGFHPQDSLVAVLLRGTRLVCTLRADLDAGTAPVTEVIVNASRNSDAHRVLLAVYSHDDTVALLPYSQDLAAALIHEGIEVGEVLLVHPDQFWSLLCTDPACCPPEGRPIPDGTTALESAQIARGSLAVASSRQAVADRYAPRPDLAASEDAYRAASKSLDAPLPDRCTQALADLTLITSSSGRHDGIDPAEVDLARARLTVLLDDTIVRDHLLATLATGPDDPAAAEALTQAAITAPEFLRPAVAVTAAAIQAAFAGSPVAIWALLDLAEGEYLALLLQAAISAGLPPSHIRDALAAVLPEVRERIGN